MEFIQNFDEATLGVLNARKSFHLNMRAGGIDTTGNHKRRLPAWARISVPGSDAPDIVMTKDGYTGRYRASIDNRPSRASLRSISLQRVTGQAPKLNLTLEINIEFEVYTYDAFEEYAKHYLRRDPERNLLTVEWGNGDSFDGRGIVYNKIEGAAVVSGGYTNTDQNTYDCKIFAIGPAQAIVDIDIMSCDVAPYFPGQKFFYGADFLGSKEPVTSLVTKMIYDLQKGGQSRTENFADGEEPISNGMNNGNPVGKVYEKFEGSYLSRLFENMTNRSDERSGLGSDAHEFVSLEYIVDLINKTVLESVTDKCGRVYGFEIGFQPNDLHYSYAPTSELGGNFRSADPVGVLFIGGPASGVYKNNSGDGKDFQVGGTYFNDCVVEGKVNHKKILISRQIVATKMFEIAHQINEAKEKEQKDSKTGTSRLSDINYPLQDFFDFLFKRISAASGNFINLSLRAEDYTKERLEKSDVYRLIIYDALVKTKTPSYFEFDPLKGDGTSFSVVIDGKLPENKTLQIALLPGTGEGSGTSGLLSQDEKAVKELQKKVDELKIKLTSTDEEKGVYARMAKKNFSEDTINDAVSSLSEFKKDLNALKILTKTPSSGFSFTEYFDLEMKVETEGIFPVIAGNVITSTNLPSFARPENNIGFAVMNVEDKIEAPGIWTTSISARATPYL
jgi:hypothetical protein